MASEDKNKKNVSISDFRIGFSENFEKCVRGFHLINSDPIKESNWETINSMIFQASGCEVTDQAHGGHASGSDISCALGNISNKSAKFDDTVSDNGLGFSISSYRLTKVCDAAKTGDIANIISEINKRKNFQYYSVIVRREKDSIGEIDYSWYLIPSDHPTVMPQTYNWKPMIGKQGKNKGEQTGWETDSLECGAKMKIVFSMSSQLWMTLGNVSVDAMQEFCVARTVVSNKSTYNYLQLADLMNKLV